MKKWPFEAFNFGKLSTGEEAFGCFRAMDAHQRFGYITTGHVANPIAKKVRPGGACSGHRRRMQPANDHARPTKTVGQAGDAFRALRAEPNLSCKLTFFFINFPLAC